MLDAFAVLGLPPSWQVTSEVLAAAFHCESRKSHPDRFYGQPDAIRRAALSRTADVTAAYRSLKELPARARYLIEKSGKTVAEAGGVGVPPEFLAEVLEAREAAQAWRAAGSQGLAQLGQLHAEFAAKLAAAEAHIAAQFAAADAGEALATVAERLRVVLAQHKYLSQTLDEIQRARASLGG